MTTAHKPDDFVFLQLQPEFLKESDLPPTNYPVPKDELEKILSSDGSVGFPFMLYWLQEYSECLAVEWKTLDTAMLRLSEIIAPKDNMQIGDINTPDFYLELQQNDLEKETITIQRGGRVLVTIRPTTDFKLSISVFHPLDAKSIRYLMVMARHPHPEYGVQMRENNWEFALDNAAGGAGSFYADQRGESYLAYWKNGLGILNDEGSEDSYKEYRQKVPLMPNIIAAQIGTFYELVPELY
jgi:hypothetical protein